MRLDVYRERTIDNATPGRLFMDGVFACYTLEDAVRTHKIAHETAIPAGVYPVVIDRSQRFQRMLPHVLNVPDFDGIRMHAGNTTADTAGCILVGLTRDGVTIGESRAALEHVQSRLAKALAIGDRVTLTIHPACRLA
jgi:hypothetical protein